VRNARFYFRFRPPRLRVAADPEFVTHRRYGVPAPRITDIEEAVRTTQVNPTGELPEPLPVRKAYAALSRLDAFEPTPTDREDVARPILQFQGQFLLDRDGIISWTNVECAAAGLSGLGQFPTATGRRPSAPQVSGMVRRATTAWCPRRGTRHG
jgi:hypothetical protein